MLNVTCVCVCCRCITVRSAAVHQDVKQQWICTFPELELSLSLSLAVLSLTWGEALSVSQRGAQVSGHWRGQEQRQEEPRKGAQGTEAVPRRRPGQSQGRGRRVSDAAAAEAWQWHQGLQVQYELCYISICALTLCFICCLTGPQGCYGWPV